MSTIENARPRWYRASFSNYTHDLFATDEELLDLALAIRGLMESSSGKCRHNTAFIEVCKAQPRPVQPPRVPLNPAPCANCGKNDYVNLDCSNHIIFTGANHGSY